jgi:hypothetical protein
MSCKYCEKPYTKKSSLDRHQILCEFIFKTKREKKIEEEETSDLPSYHALVRIIGELALKNEKLEERIHQLEQNIPKKKMMIQPIHWLTFQPQQTFKDLHTNLHITPDHIEQLMEKKFKPLRLVLQILEQLQKIPYLSLPIACFTEKKNKLYIYNTEADADADSAPNFQQDFSWTELSDELLIKFLNQLDQKMWKEFRQWQQNNLQKINMSEQLSIKRDEMQSKIAGMDYKETIVIHKIRAHLYTLLKCDYHKTE